MIGSGDRVLTVEYLSGILEDLDVNWRQLSAIRAIGGPYEKTRKVNYFPNPEEHSRVLD